MTTHFAMPTSSPPSVSIAIPLYRSAPWAQNILRNIADIDHPNVEIIISDQHCADTALAILEQKLRHDARIRFVRATDGPGWVTHYNRLLESASGDYFLWMPHDDSFSAGYVSGLVAALEGDPAAVLAYGRMECETTGEVPLAPRLLRLPEAGTWSPRDAGCLFARGNDAGVAFRGMFRRQRVVECGLYIRPTVGLVLADLYWLLALALLGPFRFVPSSVCRKRFHAGSAHSGWIYTPRVRLDGLRVVRSYLHDYCTSRKDRSVVMWHFSLWTLRRLLDRLRG